jgi:hypothetical protein
VDPLAGFDLLRVGFNPPVANDETQELGLIFIGGIKGYRDEVVPQLSDLLRSVVEIPRA